MGRANGVCRVLVEEKKPLYRWYHTDKVISTYPSELTFHLPATLDIITVSRFAVNPETGTHVQQAWHAPKHGQDPKQIIDESCLKLAFEMANIPGISRFTVSPYVVSVQLANELFSWDYVEGGVLSAINTTLNTPVRIVDRKKQ